MKIIFTFFLAIIFSIAQGQIITFQKTYHIDSTTVFNQVTPLATGGYIACGSTRKDYLVVKMDQNGQVLWSKQIGDSINKQTAYRVGEMIGGGYYLLGLIDSATSGTGVVNLLKLDANGNTIWNKTYVANDVDDLSYPSIRQIANGDFIISASFTDGNTYGEFYMITKTDSNGNVLWSSSVAQASVDKPKCYDIEESYNHNAYTTVGDGYWDGLYVVSHGINGNLLWAKKYSDTYSSSIAGHTVAKTNDGGYIISTNADYYFKPMLVKIDSLGNFLWSKSYVSPAVSGAFVGNTSVSKTTDGGFILASLKSSTSPTTAYPYLIKTNSSGNIQWAKYYTLGKDVNSTFPYILVKQTSDKGYVIAANSYSAGSGTSGWVIKTDSLGKTACNYSVVSLSDSIIVLNTSIPSITGPSVTSIATTYTTANVTIIYPLSCIDTGTTSTDTTNTHDTTVVTTRIINQTMGNKKISIFPNPSAGEFSIQKGDIELKSINVYNIQGENIYEALSFPPNQPTTLINISTRPKGVYILKVVSDVGTNYSRLIIQ